MTLISIIFFFTKPNKAFQIFKSKRDGMARVGMEAEGGQR